MLDSQDVTVKTKTQELGEALQATRYKIKETRRISQADILTHLHITYNNTQKTRNEKILPIEARITQ